MTDPTDDAVAAIILEAWADHAGCDDSCSRAWMEREAARENAAVIVALVREAAAVKLERERYDHSLICGESPSDDPRQQGRDWGIGFGLGRAAEITRGGS